MVSAVDRSALITGANTGLGKDLARQLAMRGDFSKIYLACRDPEKARPQRRLHPRDPRAPRRCGHTG
jgi:NAD(P)-dependent dehydrogenase (short-subunit alcohol dehydrogenase family)